MTIPSFLNEYADYKRESISRNELIDRRYKDSALYTIDKAMSIVERGLITIDEAIETINNPFIFCK